MSRQQDPEIVEVDVAALQGLVERTKGVLPAEDHEFLKSIVQTLFTLVQLVRQGRSALSRLRRLCGLASSEKTADIFPDTAAKSPEAPGETATDSAAASDTSMKAGAGAASKEGEGEPAVSRETEAAAPTTADSEDDDKEKPKGHGRTPASEYPEACQIEVLHKYLHPGQGCPLCRHGTLFAMKEPARILRIVGQPPLVGRCWNCQRLRCSGCGFVFTATAPPEAQGPKHTETAAAMIALMRYGGGMPHYRLAHLQHHLLAPVPTSTQWDVVNERVEGPEAAFRELCRLAAQGTCLHNDDTYMRILAFMGKRRADLLRRGALPNVDRTGLYTTAIVAIIEEGRPIALYFTGRKHAGENLNALLHQRAAGLPSPTLMCDALDRNLPADHKVVLSNCINHARRHVIDEVANFPAECRHVLEMLRKVFNVDEQCRTLRLSDEERLRLHQRESGPVMDEIKAWMEEQFENKLVEPNSGLGDAFNYMLKRWDNFTLFLRVPGAPLHNNVAERALKKSIRHRKNSLFYRNARGAYVGDLYMTLIHTTELSGGNAFHYLTELMRRPKAVADDPGAWLPWTYQATLARLHRDVSLGEAKPSHSSASRPPTTTRMAAPHPPTIRDPSGRRAPGAGGNRPPSASSGPRLPG